MNQILNGPFIKELKMEEEKEWNDYRFPFAAEETWKKYLKENGFVVISNYLSQQECSKSVDRLWDTVSFLSEGKLKKEDETTHSKSQNYPFNLHGGMIQYLGHSQIQWDMRKRCKPIYQKLWGTNQLSCSFDGFCFMNGKRKYGYSAPDSFLHTDQSPSKPYHWCYQGLINLIDCGPDSGGFVAVPLSHLKHKQYFKSHNITGHKNWYMVPEHHKNQPPFLPVEKLVLEAGDFVIWDGRTFHCNTTPSNEDMRVCVYVCMIPSATVPPLTKIKRKEFFQQNKSTNHHPGDGMKQALECPRFMENKEHFLELVYKASDVDKKDPDVLAMI